MLDRAFNKPRLRDFRVTISLLPGVANGIRQFRSLRQPNGDLTIGVAQWRHW